MPAHDDTLPIIAGITETAQSDPGLKLSSVLSGMLPRPTRDRLNEALETLEGVFDEETNEKTKARIGAAITMLRGRRNRMDD